MYDHTPPAPPPKPPGSHDVSRMSTPATSSQLPRPPPPLPETIAGELAAVAGEEHTTVSPQQEIPDPGDQWLPKFLEDKSYVLPCSLLPLLMPL